MSSMLLLTILTKHVGMNCVIYGLYIDEANLETARQNSGLSEPSVYPYSEPNRLDRANMFQRDTSKPC